VGRPGLSDHFHFAPHQSVDPRAAPLPSPDDARADRDDCDRQSWCPVETPVRARTCCEYAHAYARTLSLAADHDPGEWCAGVCSNHGRSIPRIIAVGMPVTRHPPRRSVRADFPHTAPTLGVWRRIAYQGTGARYVAWASIAWPKTGNATKACGRVGSVALWHGTSTARLGPGSSSDSAYCLARRNNCNAHGLPAEAMLRGGEQGHDADASGWL
jgi:hypothetical protein